MEPTVTTIGRDRMQDAYLCRTLAEAGAPVVFASDWPVTDISVLRGIGAALTRPTYDAPGCTDQRLDLGATLAAYTSVGAWAAFRDGLTGRLTPGLAADMVVLSGDIEATPAAAIGAMTVVRTICGGRTTWSG